VYFCACECFCVFVCDSVYVYGVCLLWVSVGCLCVWCVCVCFVFECVLVCVVFSVCE